MNFNLQMLNALVGLCRGIHGLPSDLYELGYKDKFIEKEFVLVSRIHTSKSKVNPELVMVSSNTKHTILVEIKSGANTEDDQLNRYSQVTSEDLIRQLGLRKEEVENLDVAIIGKSIHGKRLQIGISKNNLKFPLILNDDKGLALSYNNFKVDEVNKVFDPCLIIDFKLAPMSYFPFNEESLNSEVAEIIFPYILEEVIKREPKVKKETICAKSSSWDMIGRPGKDILKSKVDLIFKKMAKTEFRAYFKYNKGVLDILYDNFDYPQGNNIKGFKKIRSLQKAFLERLKKDEDHQVELLLIN